ncbi:hypothetical protein FQA39_LY17703 [Lamprigera yunnana]|nr:hypothetical protein FQA39_LY17703 [Lamprigera yunnana]
MAEGKKRPVNFSHTEEAVLIALVKKYQSIVESKESDVDVFKQENTCWSKIEVEFNSLSGDIFRSDKVLRKKYDNIKIRTKKKFSDEKSCTLGKGEDLLKRTKFSNIEIELKKFLAIGWRVMFPSLMEMLKYVAADMQIVTIEERNIRLQDCNDTSKKGEGKMSALKNLGQKAVVKESSELSKKTFLEKEQKFKLLAMREKHELEISLMKQKK